MLKYRKTAMTILEKLGLTKDKRQIAGSNEEQEETLKVSLYLTPKEINALDEQIIKRRKVTGRSIRRSYLIREALQFWLEHKS